VLKEHSAGINGEVLTFTDTDALRAFDIIIKRRPAIIALERLFAVTPRGVALINRIKADPTLIQSEIRVVSQDGRFRVSPRAAVAASEPPSSSATAPAAAAAPLDQRGTRRAPRFKIAGSVGAIVDGNPTTLVDLSTVGAQVISSVTLKPNQRVRMSLSDEHGVVRLNAAVAWAKFEIPANSGPRYRAGIAFVNPDSEGVDGFCSRHKA
jgi:hypothetical protein